MKQTLEMPADVLAVTFRPDGRQLCCACLNGTLQLWGTDGGDLQGIIEGRRDIAGELLLLVAVLLVLPLLLAVGGGFISSSTRAYIDPESSHHTYTAREIMEHFRRMYVRPFASRIG